MKGRVAIPILCLVLFLGADGTVGAVGMALDEGTPLDPRRDPSDVPEIFETLRSNGMRQSITNQQNESVNDAAAPRILNLSMPLIGDVWALVRWETDEPTAAKVRWGPSGGPLDRVNETTEFAPSHQFNLTGLSPGGLFEVRISVWDETGNAANATTQFKTVGEQPGFGVDMVILIILTVAAGGLALFTVRRGHRQ